jgi:hypothetical protein
VGRPHLCGALLAVGCVGLAGASLALRAAPSFDPWAWIGFGRGVVDPAVGFSTLGRTGWKPLPVLFTAPLGLLGGAAPSLWLVVVRSAGFAATVLAFRLAARGGGPAAGVVAAVALWASSDWLRYLSAGNIEPVVVALLLGAVELHFCDRRSGAFVLAALAGLARPEIWPLVVGYGVILAFTQRRWWTLALGVPGMFGLWVGPDWLGSGDPFHTFHAAGRSAEPHALQLAHHPALQLIRGAAAILAAPVWIGALVAVMLGWRARDRTVLVLTAVAGALALPTIAATGLGYPAVPRYLLAPAAVCCLLGAIGLIAIARVPKRAAARHALAVAAACACVPFAVSRAGGLGHQVADARQRGDHLAALWRAVDRARRITPVACLHPAIRPSSYTNALAWKLGLEPHSVGGSLGPPGRVAFLAGGGRTAAKRLPRGATVTPIIADGPWRVVVVRWGNAPPASTCTGPRSARRTAARRGHGRPVSARTPGMRPSGWSSPVRWTLDRWAVWSGGEDRCSCLAPAVCGVVSS